MKRILSMVLSAALLVSALAGCQQAPASNGGETGGDTVKIGGLAPLTGDVSVYGIAVDNAIKLKVEEVNAAGGILGGKQIEYIVYDEKGDPTEAVNAYNKLVQDDKVVALVGDVTTKPTIAVAQKSVADNLPMITASGTGADITLTGENIFRACFIDPFQGQLMASYAKEKLGATTAAIIYDNGDDYSTGIADALRDSGEDNRLYGHGYAVYTNLIYKSLLGKNAAQLRKERGADRQAVAKDFLTSDELPAYEKKEAAVAVLLDAGLRYEQIKPIILENKKSRSVAVRR